jgi:hypothetical protein
MRDATSETKKASGVAANWAQHLSRQRRAAVECGSERGEDKDECRRQCTSGRRRATGAGRFGAALGASVPVRTTVIYHYR